MAKRGKKYDGIGEALALICLFLLCFLSYLLLIGGVTVVIIGVINKIERNKVVKQIIQPPFKDAKIKNNANTSKKKKKLGIFNKSVYDGLFSAQIRKRGELYAYEGKIKALTGEEKEYSCIVQGTKDYKVEITFDKKDRLIDSICNCPYCYLEEKNCKHIYALLYKVKCSENRGKIISEIENQISGIKAVLKVTMDYLETNKSHFSFSIINAFNRRFEEYNEQISCIESSISSIILEDELLEKLDDLLRISAEAKRKIRKIINAENRANATSDKNVTSNKAENHSYDGDCDTVYYSVYDDDAEYNYDEESEREMAAYDLEEWKKS